MTFLWHFHTRSRRRANSPSRIAEALANITEAGGVDPVIEATILFSESGFVSVPEAIAYAEIRR
jgi:hypothetical protein